MKREKYSYENSAIRVCLDGKGEAGIFGSMHSPFWKEEKCFQDIVTIFMNIEELMDDRGFPEPMYKSRTFKKTQRIGEESHGTIYRTQEALSKEHGHVETMLVYVTSRKHTSIQGHVVTLSTGKIQKYKSELQLLRIIEEQFVVQKKIENRMIEM